MTQAKGKTTGRLAAMTLAAAATAMLAVPVRAALESSGRLDVPNHRSSHSRPVPRGGGVACLLGAAAAAALTRVRPSTRVTASVAVLSGVGWLDDTLGHLPAPLRLTSQLVVGATFLSHDAQDHLVAPLVTSGVVNVVNFMDGINGISGLTGVVWGVNAMLLEDEGSDLAVLGALTAGVCLGFLPHNVPQARLFLGDVGSYALGSAMAAGILGQRSLRTRYRVAAPLLLYGVDATQALLRRVAAGEPLSEAHRQHIYQRLVDDRGLKHMDVALIHAAGAAVLALASRLHPVVSVPLAVAVAGAYLRAPGSSDRPTNRRSDGASR